MPVLSPLFSERLAGDLHLKHRLGQQLLQAGVLRLKLFEAFGLGHAHAAELTAPQVVRRFAEAVLPA